MRRKAARLINMTGSMIELNSSLGSRPIGPISSGRDLRAAQRWSAYGLRPSTGAAVALSWNDNTPSSPAC